MSEIDPRVERVARALCQVDGKKPDDEHKTNENETTRAVAQFEFGQKSIPNWQGYDYVKEATRFVAAFDALNKD